MSILCCLTLDDYYAKLAYKGSKSKITTLSESRNVIDTHLTKISHEELHVNKNTLKIQTKNLYQPGKANILNTQDEEKQKNHGMLSASATTITSSLERIASYPMKKSSAISKRSL